MMTPNSHSVLVKSIERAVAHLADALIELDSVPSGDKATIGFAAHAINNYLSVSEATLDLLFDRLRGHQDPEVTRWLEGLRQVSKLMQHSVSRMVNASAPKDFPLKPESLDLATLMHRACDYYRGPAERKQLAVEYRSSPDTPRVWADSVAVAVVADNLLSNAVKYSGPGGKIEVETQPGPGGVVCRVCDHGSGLTSKQISQLFRMGTPRGAVPTGGEPSHGYGLAIAKELVDRMSGRIWAESEPGQGACFSFSLPYDAHAEKDRP